MRRPNESSQRSHVYFVRRRITTNPLDRLLAAAEEVMIAGDYLTARAIFLEVLRVDDAQPVARRGLEEIRQLLVRDCRMASPLNAEG